MISFDASVLIALDHKNTPEERRLRLRALVTQAEKSRTRIMIPAPALCEYLAGAGDARAALYNSIQQSKVFSIGPFADRANYECSVMLDQNKSKASRRAEGQTWAKAKFDWQIVAIAKVEGATPLYTLDDDIVRLGRSNGVDVVLVDDMPLPDSARQRPLPLASQAPATFPTLSEGGDW